MQTAMYRVFVRLVRLPSLSYTTLTYPSLGQLGIPLGPIGSHGFSCSIAAPVRTTWTRSFWIQ